MTQMAIYIQGGSGFVGGHLVRRLAADGHQVTVGSRYPKSAQHLCVVPGVKVVRADPFDADGMATVLAGHQVVINLVGILNERGFGGRGFQRAHVDLVEALIAAAEVATCQRFLHISSLNAGQGSSHYLLSRGRAEALIAEAARRGPLQTTVFRPSTIFGPDDSFLNRFASLLKLSPMLPLARPEARFQPVFVGDVVEAMAVSLTDSKSHGQVYELGGSEIWALKPLVVWLKEQLGLTRAVVGLPDLLGRLQGAVFDFVPGKPFSSDNYRSLLIDSVCSGELPGFEALGIEPWGMSELAPTWLCSSGKQDRYQNYRRKAGR